MALPSLTTFRTSFRPQFAKQPLPEGEKLILPHRLLQIRDQVLDIFNPN